MKINPAVKLKLSLPNIKTSALKMKTSALICFVLVATLLMAMSLADDEVGGEIFRCCFITINVSGM